MLQGCIECWEGGEPRRVHVSRYEVKCGAESGDLVEFTLGNDATHGKVATRCDQQLHSNIKLNFSQGCGSAFIFCESGSSCLSQCESDFSDAEAALMAAPGPLFGGIKTPATSSRPLFEKFNFYRLRVFLFREVKTC